jgi:hypothetical protein
VNIRFQRKRETADQILKTKSYAICQNTTRPNLYFASPQNPLIYMSSGNYFLSVSHFKTVIKYSCHYHFNTSFFCFTYEPIKTLPTFGGFPLRLLPFWEFMVCSNVNVTFFTVNYCHGVIWCTLLHLHSFSGCTIPDKNWHKFQTFVVRSVH